MTDEAKALVERLRRFSSRPMEHDAPVMNRIAMDEAADLIETQAREIERLGVIAGGNARLVCKTLDEKDAEIERLRYGIASAALWTAEPGITLTEIRAALGESHDQ